MTDEDGHPDKGARVEALVATIVGSIAPLDVHRVEPDQRLVFDLGYNSLLLVELVFALEDLFSLVPSGPEDLPPVVSVEQLQQYVRAKLDSGMGTVPSDDEVREFLRER